MEGAVPPPARVAPRHVSSSYFENIEEEYYDVDLSWAMLKPLTNGVALAFPYAIKAINVMDSIGGYVSRKLGLTQSRFQYAVDEYYRLEKQKLEKQAAEKRQKRLEQQQSRYNKNDDSGSSHESVDDDGEAPPYCPPLISIEVEAQ